MGDVRMACRSGVLVVTVALCACVDPTALSQQCAEPDHPCADGSLCVDGVCARGLSNRDAGGAGLDAGPLDGGDADPDGGDADGGVDGDAGVGPDAGGLDAGEPDAGDDVGPCADGSVFLRFYPDDDLDSVSDGRVEACVNGLPQNATAQPRYAPLVLAAPQALNNIPGGDEAFVDLDPWRLVRDDDETVATDDLDGFLATSLLMMTQWAIEPPPAGNVTGFRVHISRYNNEDQGVLRDAVVQLIVGGVRVGDNKADMVSDWPVDNAEWATYGGPEDAWGLQLTVTDLDADFGLALQANHVGDGSDEAHLDAVIIEVFLDEGTFDCSLGDDTGYALVDVWNDSDEDFWGAGQGQQCLSWRPPAGRTLFSFGDDCYDVNDRVHPGATSYYSSDRGDGSFDYNCDGSFSRQSVTEVLSCMCVSTSCAAVNNTYTPTGACGGLTSEDFCQSTLCAGCVFVVGTTTIRCR